MLWAIAFATPFFVLWGWLSDRIGRKWIMMVGMLLGIITYRPIFNTFLDDTTVDKVIANMNPPESTTYRINEKQDTIATMTFKNYVSISHTITVDMIITDTAYAKHDPNAYPSQHVEFKNKKLSSTLYWKFVGLVFILILYVTMVYGPIAAFLVEMFPTKIRYTSMSLPYHIGNGVFGGLVPFIGLLLTTTFTKDPLVGLWYPIAVAALCFIIGSIYLTNKIDKDVTD